MPKDATFLSVLSRHRSVRSLFFAQAFSLLALQICRVLIPTLAVLVANASSAEVAALAVAEYLPGVALSPVVGSIADRFPARAILLACDSARVVTLGLLALYMTGHGQYLFAAMAVAAATVGAVSAMFDVTAATVVPRTIPADDQPERMTATSGIASLQFASLIAGPTLGGLVAQVMKAGSGLAVSACLFVGSLLFLPGIRVLPAAYKGSSEGGVSSRRSPRAEGFGFVWRSRAIRTIVGGAGLFNFGGSAIGALFVVYVYRDLGIAPLVAGISFALNGVGMIAGVRLARWAIRRWGEWEVIRRGAALCAAAVVLIPLAPHGFFSAVVIFVYQVSFGIGAGCWSLAMSMTIQRATPAHVLGRVNASLRAVSTGAAPVGAGLAALLSAYIGVREAIAALAIIVVASALVYVGRKPVLDIAAANEEHSDQHQ